MVTVQHVVRARRLMRTGSSMKEAAIILGVRSVDLDQALWVALGTDLETLLGHVVRPDPMF
jgi:hypothetical protein